MPVKGAGDVIETATGEPLSPGRAAGEIEHLLVGAAPDKREVLRDRLPVPAGSAVARASKSS